jgi:hypothetical protein
LLRGHTRTIATDQEWVDRVSDVSYSDFIFQRVSAKHVRFENVDFRYSVFDTSYFRDCTFDSCNFTGCRFVGSSFPGSAFLGCRFDYAVFERTFIDSDVLDNIWPPYENLKLRLARTLRTNYQTLGDTDAANKAILVELHATRVHLSKAWRSREAYYRNKYSGAERAIAFLAWARFVVGDFIWGNGESASRLLRTFLLIIILIATFDTILSRNAGLIDDWVGAFVDATAVFLGTKQSQYPALIEALIALSRYILLGLFVSILVRRFSRR